MNCLSSLAVFQNESVVIVFKYFSLLTNQFANLKNVLYCVKPFFCVKSVMFSVMFRLSCKSYPIL